MLAVAFPVAPDLLRRRGRAHGFTLNELMVVLVLVGITAAVMLPEMKGTYEEALLRSASRELVNVFQQAYSQSVSLNQTHRVVFQASTGRYRLERAVSTFAEPDFVPANDVAGAEGEIDNRVTLSIRKPSPAGQRGTEEDEHSSIPDDAFEFYADGTASEGSVFLRDRQGFGLALRINPVTSRVRVVPVTEEQ